MITKREREVLAYLAHGLTYEQTAARMGVSPQTVKNHTSSAFKKLRVGNRFGAFLELGWMNPPEVTW
jgi:DNA-binding CsgD family transcriptional regulator